VQGCDNLTLIDVLIFMSLLMLQLFLEFVVMAVILNSVFKARLKEAVAIAAQTIKSEFQGVSIDLRGPLRELLSDEDFQATLDDLINEAGDQLQARIETVASKYVGGDAGAPEGGDIVGGIAGKVLKRFLG